MSIAEVKSAIKLLTSTMRDPMRSKVCRVTLSSAADRINQELEGISVSAGTKFVKAYPGFLRAGIAFLTTERALREHVAMFNHLQSPCRCDLSRDEIARLHTSPRDRTIADRTIQVFDVVATVVNCLVLAFADLTQHKFRAGKTKNGEQYWPHGPEDLLPNGLKGSIAGLELWIAGPPQGDVVFRLAGRLALFHVPFASELFEPGHNFTMRRPMQHLQKAIELFNDSSPSGSNPPEAFSRPVKTVVQFLDDLMRCDTARFNIMTVTVRDSVSPVITSLNKILSTLPLEEWRETRLLVQHIATWANADVDMKTGLVTARFERSSIEPFFASDNHLKSHFEAMTEARKTGCLNITCPSTQEAIHSRLCSQCNLIRYCGEKCQKEAWKCDSFPHKSLCTKIKSLRVSFGDDWPLFWSPDFTYTQFEMSCKSKAVDLQVVEAVVQTIRAVHVQQKMFREETERAGASQISRLAMAEQQKEASRRIDKLKAQMGPELTVLTRDSSLSAIYPNAYRQ